MSDDMDIKEQIIETEILTRIQAARYLKISVAKMDQLGKSGEIRRAKIGKGSRARVLFRLEDLRAYIKENLEESKTCMHYSA